MDLFVQIYNATPNCASVTEAKLVRQESFLIDSPLYTWKTLDDVVRVKELKDSPFVYVENV